MKSRKFHQLPVRVYIGINLFLCTSVTYIYRTCFNLILRDMVQTSQPPVCSNSLHHHYVRIFAREHELEPATTIVSDGLYYHSFRLWLDTIGAPMTRST